jgi:hypothetical protein
MGELLGELNFPCCTFSSNLVHARSYRVMYPLLRVRKRVRREKKNPNR